MRRACITILILFVFAGCSQQHSEVSQRRLTVSLPVMSYFVERLAPSDVSVNVMIPKGADHDSYSPKPSQMAALSHSDAYIAIGPLEFERVWKSRFISSAPSMLWYAVDSAVSLINGGHCHEHHDCSHDADPHFWLSPKQVPLLCANIASVLKSLYPSDANYVDSALMTLLSDVRSFDMRLDSMARQTPQRMFVIYHPSLSYVARDYGFRQLSLGNEGAAPQPMRYAQLVDSARRAHAEVVFLQRGQSTDMVEGLVRDLGAHIVMLQPDAAEWNETMETIIEALR